MWNTKHFQILKLTQIIHSLKDHLPHIFTYLRKGLDNQGHKALDMFIAISDFLDVNYEKLYDLIGVKYKEEILVELERKYQVLSSKNEKRLF